MSSEFIDGETVHAKDLKIGDKIAIDGVTKLLTVDFVYQMGRFHQTIITSDGVERRFLPDKTVTKAK